MDGATKDTTAFPEWNANVAKSMRGSLEKYADWVFWGDGKLGTLLTDNHAFVDKNLAGIYQAAPPAADMLTLVSVNNQPRAGLLTQAGLMSALAKAANDSPVYRGGFVLNSLLCVPPPAPPANVPAFAEVAPGSEARTTRARQEHAQTEQSAPRDST